MSDCQQGKKACINGIQMYYEVSGNSCAAHTIVLLHGFLSSSFSFRMLVPYLSKDFRVLSVDLPPFGYSDKTKKFYYSYKNIAATVLQLLEEIDIERFSVAGHSMGGQIALNMMLQSPEKIDKGILLSSSGYYARAKRHHILASYLPFFPVYVKHYLGKTGVVGNLRSVVYDQSLIDKTMIEGYAKQFESTEIFPALARLLRHREGDLPEKSLQSIETPCLLIWGENDKIVPVNIGKRLSIDLPHAQLVVFKETGHLVPEERPKEVYEEISSFIN
ncbi:alpha/beta fold hydrolase [Siminovitchia fordii]|uniref:Hydrolase n=1 Tax=Siminovitchia fordii TaxID=254759 RepID=A0ABQ4K405_9BACI|nr:alpha/beta hydrolase [Siminovitchia fordii]GIN19863.1 hydrolase [Siminovitchia fordii]